MLGAGLALPWRRLAIRWPGSSVAGQRMPSERKAVAATLIVMSDPSGLSAEVLIVREALPGELPGAQAMLAHDGWPSTPQATFVVVFDPCEQIVRGAAAVRRRCHCTYELAAWAVGDDRVGAIEQRLVRAVADRVRRGGGRRLVASLDGLSPEQVAVLTQSGFVPNTSAEVGLALDD